MDNPFKIPKAARYEEIRVADEDQIKQLKKSGWKQKSRSARSKYVLRKKLEPWQLFEREVFIFFKESLKFSYVAHGKRFGRSQVDVAAGIDDTLLIIDCKTKDKPGPKNLHAYITSHSGKRGTIIRNVRQKFGNKYKNIIFILALRDIDYSEKDVEYASDSGVFLWGEIYIEILKEFYKIFGPESRYLFLKELGQEHLPIRGDGKGRYYEVPALLLTHNGHKIYNFFIEAKKLLKLAYVARIESGSKQFYQRLVAKSRLKEIASFIEDGESFKNSIIVSFEAKPKKLPLISKRSAKKMAGAEPISLRIRKDHSSLWIIDGQHRLYGYSRVAETFKNNFLSVVAIENIDTSEQAKTFIDINQKQKPVDSSLLWELLATLKSGEEEGAISSLVMHLASKGAFHGKIYIPGRSRRRRKSYGIFFSNFCKGILDRNILDENDNNSLFRHMGPEGYVSGKGIKRVSAEIEAYFALLVSIAGSAQRRKWINGFIFTNNGLNIFLRVFSLYLAHCHGRINRSDMRRLLRSPLKEFFIERADSIDELRRTASSEGTRENIAHEIVRLINKRDESESFASEYLLRKDKSLKGTDVYKAYVNLEKHLRKYIKRRLEKTSPNWWNDRMPGDVRQRAEDAFKKGEGQNPVIDAKRREPLDCLDFMDYPKIFTRNDNWNEVFKQSFKDEEAVRVWFREAKPIRNKIAHPADMSSEEKAHFLRFTARVIALAR